MHFSAWICGHLFFDLLASLDLITQEPLLSNLDIKNVSVNVKPTFKLLDVGSFNFNGDLTSALPYSTLSLKYDIKYTGIDMIAGPNVDIVVSDKHSVPYPFRDHYFDAIITSSALEHDPKFWMTYLKMLKVIFKL